MILVTVSDISQLSVTVTDAWEKGSFPSILGTPARRHVAEGACGQVEITSQQAKEKGRNRGLIVSTESIAHDLKTSL